MQIRSEQLNLRLLVTKGRLAAGAEQAVAATPFEKAEAREVEAAFSSTHDVMAPTCFAGCCMGEPTGKKQRRPRLTFQRGMSEAIVFSGRLA